jgi:Tfp pilus assembly protein FimV
MKSAFAIALFSSLLLSGIAAATSKRVEVYSLTREYWDVRPGDTLSGIAAELLPGNVRHQQQLQRDLVRLNPHAFIDGDPALLIARQRLWLPNAVTRPVQSSQPNAEIERLGWGYIKRFN